jgi:hypothetical protein
VSPVHIIWRGPHAPYQQTPPISAMPFTKAAQPGQTVRFGFGVMHLSAGARRPS